MNKTQKMKKAARNARKQNAKQIAKNIIAVPGRAVKRLWNWLKSIDIIGMINLTLLVAIIILFLSLISDFICCNKCEKQSDLIKNTVAVQDTQKADTRRVVQRRFKTTLPAQADKQTGITPKIKTVGVAKPEVIRELSVPATELPKQKLYGDVIIERHPASPILSNGVRIDGNLFIQNMRKYTIPCDAKINGNMFIRNVEQVSFCGGFTVNGNIYVNRQSSFGPIPSDAKIRGQIIL